MKYRTFGRLGWQVSLANLGLGSLDLIQFHVWEDDWADDPRWQRALDDLKRQGLVRAAGVSVNRWESWNVLRTLRTGLIDAVQVIYNLFDQAPEDELFPACRERGVAEMALRFILSNPDVTTVIPGMRRPAHVRANVAASDAGPLPRGLVSQLRQHRWDRVPTEWSQ
jgi:aryl-alcohol dehydrogenase-like predicted oxidoreductase